MYKLINIMFWFNSYFAVACVQRQFPLLLSKFLNKINKICGSYLIMGKSKLTKNSFQIKFSYGSFPVLSYKSNHFKKATSGCPIKKVSLTNIFSQVEQSITQFYYEHFARSES